jgi:hypothetical protein
VERNVVAYFKILYRQFPGLSGKSHEKHEKSLYATGIQTRYLPHTSDKTSTAWTNFMGNLQINPITTLKSKMSHYFIFSLYPSTLSIFSPFSSVPTQGNPSLLHVLIQSPLFNVIT